MSKATNKFLLLTFLLTTHIFASGDLEAETVQQIRKNCAPLIKRWQEEFNTPWVSLAMLAGINRLKDREVSKHFKHYLINSTQELEIDLLERVRLFDYKKRTNSIVILGEISKAILSGKGFSQGVVNVTLDGNNKELYYNAVTGIAPFINGKLENVKGDQSITTSHKNAVNQVLEEGIKRKKRAIELIFGNNQMMNPNYNDFMQGDPKAIRLASLSLEQINKLEKVAIDLGNIFEIDKANTITASIDILVPLANMLDVLEACIKKLDGKNNEDKKLISAIMLRTKPENLKSVCDELLKRGISNELKNAMTAHGYHYCDAMLKYVPVTHWDEFVKRAKELEKMNSAEIIINALTKVKPENWDQFIAAVTYITGKKINFDKKTVIDALSKINPNHYNIFNETFIDLIQYSGNTEYITTALSELDRNDYDYNAFANTAIMLSDSGCDPKYFIRELSEVNPNNYDAFANAAIILRKSGCDTFIRELSKVNPNNYDAFAKAVNTLINDGFDEQEVIRALSELNPNSYDAFANTAIMLMQYGCDPQYFIRELSKLNPNNYKAFAEAAIIVKKCGMNIKILNNVNEDSYNNFASAAKYLIEDLNFFTDYTIEKLSTIKPENYTAFCSAVTELKNCGVSNNHNIVTLLETLEPEDYQKISDICKMRRDGNIPSTDDIIKDIEALNKMGIDNYNFFKDLAPLLTIADIKALNNMKIEHLIIFKKLTPQLKNKMDQINGEFTIEDLVTVGNPGTKKTDYEKFASKTLEFMEDINVHNSNVPKQELLKALARVDINQYGEFTFYVKSIIQNINERKDKLYFVIDLAYKAKRDWKNFVLKEIKNLDIVRNNEWDEFVKDFNVLLDAQKSAETKDLFLKYKK